MQNFIKTIISAVKTWTKGEIKNSTADWNQNDSSADNYVKNRPFYEKDGVIHKLDSKYLNLPDNIATTDKVQEVIDLANAAQETADNKMDAANPVGTGSFSMNRKENSVVGDYSSALGYEVVASGKYSNANGLGVVATQDATNVLGKYNIVEPAYKEKLSTMNLKVGDYYYYASDYTFDSATGIFTLVSPSRTKLSHSSLVEQYFMPEPSGTEMFYRINSSFGTTGTSGGGTVVYIKKYMATQLDSTYAHIVGNGASDTERSNAHTLDWEGNAWFQGEVYVGGESQSDAEAVKLAKISDIPDVSSFVTEDYVNSQIAAIPTPDVSGQIDSHNISLSAHNDIRLLVNELTNRLNTLADSDDVTLDQMSELVEYIKSNKNLIEEITTKKVNISDIINNLTTNVDNKPLSAAQGVVLKELIDAIKVPTKVSELTNDSGYLTEHQSLEGLATEEYVNNLISSSGGSGSGIQTITTSENSGLKVTRTDNDVSIEFDDEIVFIFDGGNAFD